MGCNSSCDRDGEVNEAADSREVVRQIAYFFVLRCTSSNHYDADAFLFIAIHVRRISRITLTKRVHFVDCAIFFNKLQENFKSRIELGLFRNGKVAAKVQVTSPENAG